MIIIIILSFGRNKSKLCCFLLISKPCGAFDFIIIIESLKWTWNSTPFQKRFSLNKRNLDYYDLLIRDEPDVLGDADVVST